ncbi:terminase large subunit domain-containing protein [Sandaracinus amylolyticus]|uniref:terminase large subunit domain-containing protein n=1 Tax=Sandaracinus amylolyticus TaxID=927083 RepID=UPI001F2C86A3|nr:terminase family protein [Sandaracinus amylolyticus]UJR81480.1 Hypothetical protein I5071_35390 [Sandaracinus amylolyticus]
MGAIAARVARIERERAKVIARRARFGRSRAIEPGRLLTLVPRVSPQLQEPEHLEPVANEIERALDETVEVCISVPPRHGKTTLLVHAIVWLLLRDPTCTILYASYAHGFAAKQVRKAMRLAVKAGIALGDVRRRDEWTTAAGGGVKACGVGGQITGEGFRVVFVDDPHKNRAEAESRRIRERVIDGFREDIYTRQDPRGTSVFVVHTRWHENDLIGELTRAQASNDDVEAVPPFKLLNLTAISGAANDGAYGLRALAPKLFTLDRLQRLRARVGEYGWWSLYMGSPRPRSGAVFGDPNLVDELESTGTFRYAIGVDIARTARTRSDHNAAVVLRLNVETGTIDVVEALREQGVLADRRDVEREGAIDPGFARRLHALVGRYPGARVVMYTGRTEDQLLELLASHADYPVYIDAWPATTEKFERAQGWAGAYNDPRGRVRIPRKAMWASKFIAEHSAFTGNKGDPDDQVDAAAAAFDALRQSDGLEVLTPSSGARRDAADAGVASRARRRARGFFAG